MKVEEEGWGRGGGGLGMEIGGIQVSKGNNSFDGERWSCPQPQLMAAVPAILIGHSG